MHCCSGEACGHEKSWIDVDHQQQQQQQQQQHTNNANGGDNIINSCCGSSKETTSTLSLSLATLCAACQKPMHNSGLCGKLLFSDTLVCHPCYSYKGGRTSSREEGEDQETNKTKTDKF